MSEMHSPLRMEERRASLFDEGTSGIREFHNPSCVASEQVKSMLCFEVGNLFAKRRLGYVQSVRGPREVQLFGQGNDCVQVAYFDVGKHCSNPQVVDISRFVPRGSPYSDRFPYRNDWFSVWWPGFGTATRKELDLEVRDEGSALQGRGSVIEGFVVVRKIL
jgi:hypothetical protein